MASMAVTKRLLTRTNAKGKVVKRYVWRSRVADPTKPASAGIKIERTFPTEAQADDWDLEQRTAVKNGTHIAKVKGDTLLRDVAESWRATWSIKPLAPLTQRDYANILKVHVLPKWGKVKVSAIDAQGIQLWIAELSTTHHPETVHHIYGVLRGCLKTAVQHKLIHANPATKDAITLPSKKVAQATQPEQLYLTAAQVTQLANAMPTPQTKLAVELAGLLGPRSGELWAIRRQDIDLLHNRLHIRFAIKEVSGHLIGGPTKTHERRSLAIPKRLREPLAVQLASPGVKVRSVSRRPHGRTQGGYPIITAAGELGWTDDPANPLRLVFTTRTGAPIRHNNFYGKVYRPTVVKLWPKGHRLHRLRFHDLRHSNASLMLSANGGNLAIVQKRLGHSSITTTFNRYAHLLPGADQDISDALNAMFDETESNVFELPQDESEEA